MELNRHKGLFPKSYQIFNLVNTLVKGVMSNSWGLTKKFAQSKEKEFSISYPS